MPSNLYLSIPRNTLFTYAIFKGSRQTLGCVVAKMKDLVVPIARGSTDVKRDFCSKCPMFKEPLDLFEEIKAETGRTPTSVEIDKAMVSKMWCRGGERMLRTNCAMNIKYEDALVRANQAVINTPPLCFKTDINFRRSGDTLSVSVGGSMWWLKAVRNKPSFVETVTYRIGNVYEDSHICWGRGRKKLPKSPAEAFSTFFSSPFNGDLGIAGTGSGVKQNMESVNVDESLNWNRSEDLSLVRDLKENCVAESTGRSGYKLQAVRLPGDCDGVLLLTSSNFLEVAPDSAKVPVSNGKVCAFARAIKYGKGFIFSFGDGKLYSCKSITAKAIIDLMPNVEGLVNPFSRIKTKVKAEDQK